MSSGPSNQAQTHPASDRHGDATRGRPLSRWLVAHAVPPLPGARGGARHAHGPVRVLEMFGVCRSLVHPRTAPLRPTNDRRRGIGVRRTLRVDLTDDGDGAAGSYWRRRGLPPTTDWRGVPPCVSLHCSALADRAFVPRSIDVPCPSGKHQRAMLTFRSHAVACMFCVPCEHGWTEPTTHPALCDLATDSRR